MVLSLDDWSCLSDAFLAVLGPATASTSLLPPPWEMMTLPL